MLNNYLKEKKMSKSRLREVFIDIICQGIMNEYRGFIFKRKNIRGVVKTIKNYLEIMSYEKGRQRITYLEAGDL